MKKALIKLMGLTLMNVMLSFTMISPIYADTTETPNEIIVNEENGSPISPHASDYIISYSGSAYSPGSGKLHLSADVSVYDAGTRITAEIYRNGSYYDEYYASSSNDDVAMSKTISVPSGSYYVKYKYQAVVNGMAVETRTKTIPTVTVK